MIKERLIILLIRCSLAGTSRIRHPDTYALTGVCRFANQAIDDAKKGADKAKQAADQAKQAADKAK